MKENPVKDGSPICDIVTKVHRVHCVMESMLPANRIKVRTTEGNTLNVCLTKQQLQNPPSKGSLVEIGYLSSSSKEIVNPYLISVSNQPTEDILLNKIEF